MKIASKEMKQYLQSQLVFKMYKIVENFGNLIILFLGLGVILPSCSTEVEETKSCTDYIDEQDCDVRLLSVLLLGLPLH